MVVILKTQGGVVSFLELDHLWRGGKKNVGGYTHSNINNEAVWVAQRSSAKDLGTLHLKHAKKLLLVIPGPFQSCATRDSYKVEFQYACKL